MVVLCSNDALLPHTGNALFSLTQIAGQWLPQEARVSQPVIRQAATFCGLHSEDRMRC